MCCALSRAVTGRAVARHTPAGSWRAAGAVHPPGACWPAPPAGAAAVPPPSWSCALACSWEGSPAPAGTARRVQPAGWRVRGRRREEGRGPRHALPPPLAISRLRGRQQGRPPASLVRRLACSPMRTAGRASCLHTSPHPQRPPLPPTTPAAPLSPGQGGATGGARTGRARATHLPLHRQHQQLRLLAAPEVPGQHSCHAAAQQVLGHHLAGVSLACLHLGGGGGERDEHLTIRMRCH